MAVISDGIWKEIRKIWVWRVFENSSMLETTYLLKILEVMGALFGLEECKNIILDCIRKIMDWSKGVNQRNRH